MNRSKPLWILAAILLLLALAVPAPARAAEPGLVVLGNTYTLSSGETLEGNLTILGGLAIIEQGAVVEGSILLLGGKLQVDGLVEGNISAAGGVVELGNTAQVEGDISTAGATVWQADGAVIGGKIVTDSGEPVRNLRASNFHFPFVTDKVLSPLAFLVQVLVVAALAVLVMMYFPQHVARVAHAFVSQPALAGGMGLLTFLVFPLALILISVTIILIPAGVLGLLILILAYLFGWIAIGYEAGKRIIARLRWDWAPPATAGVGTLCISLIMGVLWQLPCLDWLTLILVANVGLGAVILTRFGFRAYGQDLPSGSPNPNA